MRRLALSALLAVLAACDGPPPPPPPPPKAPDFPAPPELKPAEDFARDSFLELPEGGGASFELDLGEKVAHRYSYEQESHLVMTATAKEQSGKIVSRTQWKGDAQILGGGNGRGELVFVSTPIAQWNNDNRISSEELNKISKIVAQYMMKESGVDGGPQMRSGEEDPKFALFFALPSRVLKPGESDTREIHLGFVPQDLKYHGLQEITHAGRRKVGRYECVKLRSRLELEAVPPGDGRGWMKGWIAAYFAPKEGVFVRVESSFAMAVDVRHEVRPADPHAPTHWQMNRAQADTRITVNLKD